MTSLAGAPLESRGEGELDDFCVLIHLPRTSKFFGGFERLGGHGFDKTENSLVLVLYTHFYLPPCPYSMPTLNCYFCSKTMAMTSLNRSLEVDKSRIGFDIYVPRADKFLGGIENERSDG